jgi:hypothetical protein
MEGLQPDSPPLPTARSRKISNVKPCPNWQLIKRGGLSDAEFTERYLMLSVVRVQMLKSPQRRLIPEYAWEEIVEFSILRAVTTWKGNGDGKCPLKNYAWVLLRNTGIQWWNKNKAGILDSVELDRSFMEGNG